MNRYRRHVCRTRDARHVDEPLLDLQAAADRQQEPGLRLRCLDDPGALVATRYRGDSTPDQHPHHLDMRIARPKAQ